jgi:hypothetical protein
MVASQENINEEFGRWRLMKLLCSIVFCFSGVEGDIVAVWRVDLRSSHLPLEGKKFLS